MHPGVAIAARLDWSIRNLCTTSVRGFLATLSCLVISEPGFVSLSPSSRASGGALQAGNRIVKPGAGALSRPGQPGYVFHEGVPWEPSSRISEQRAPLRKSPVSM